MNKLFSKSILKQSIKNNWKLWIIITGILCFFITVMTAVAPSIEQRLAEIHGFSLVDMYAQMFFGMMGITLMLIYAIVVGNKLVASEIDKGTMSFTLNTPTKRLQIIFTKAIFYFTSLIAMAVMVEICGTAVSSVVSMELSLNTFWLMITGFLLYGIAISGICFFASCWFNKSGNSLLLGAGLPIVFFVLNSLSGIQELTFLKYFSLNTLFDTTAIISGTGFIIQFVAMAVIGVVLYILGINKFLKKDLPL